MKNKNIKPTSTKTHPGKSRAELLFDNMEMEDKLVKLVRKKKDNTLNGLPDLHPIKIGRA
ncbi:hypothetical protein BR1R5_30520 [Pseudomonas sp. BR1R-5]|uniref:hypothetical protein n=1 Tax=Pseudomonas TaxID=286 RepID=UPI000F053109|nr:MULTISPECIES: hypothetical protein [Pseudomonas]GLH33664.1 hypothetical protein BR1R5_30520 [Pseudomonas sp. BR1R-5]